MQAASTDKSLRIGEASLAVVLAVLALACLFIAAKTIEPAFAFHMWLFVLGGAAGVFAIFRRYNVRSAGAVPLEIDGKPNYNFGPIKFASLAALFWGVAGMAVGIYIAFELAYPWLNLAPWFNFGRLRPLHTSAVIFAFGGNVLLATSFYVVQRTCRARLAGDLAPWFVILGYNFFIVIAGTGYLLGITDSKEYAEQESPEAAELLNRLQKESKLPLLFAADFERGVSMRLMGATVFPHAMAFGGDGS